MKKVILVLLYIVPFIVSAQIQPLNNVQQIVTGIRDVVRLLGPIVYSLSIIFFFWGVGKYALSAGNPKSVQDGKSIMIYGVIAIAVMSSIYGLVFFLQVSLGVTDRRYPTVPRLPSGISPWTP